MQCFKAFIQKFSFDLEESPNALSALQRVLSFIKHIHQLLEQSDHPQSRNLSRNL